MASDPVYDQLRALGASRDEKKAFALLAALPVERRIPVLCEIWLAPADFFFKPHGRLDQALRSPTTKLGKWAASFADRLVALLDEGKKVPTELRLAVFGSLVRGRVPIEPRWDVLLPLRERTALVHECIQAIPTERREAAVVAALSQSLVPSNALFLAMHLLGRYRYPAL